LIIISVATIGGCRIDWIAEFIIFDDAVVIEDVDVCALFVLKTFRFNLFADSNLNIPKASFILRSHIKHSVVILHYMVPKEPSILQFWKRQENSEIAPLIFTFADMGPGDKQVFEFHMDLVVLMTTVAVANIKFNEP